MIVLRDIPTETERSTDYGPDNNNPVHIAQHEWEFLRLLDLYRKKEPIRVLEIGTYYGGTLYNWITHAPTDAIVVNVDLSHPSKHLYPKWSYGRVFHEAIEGDSRDPEVIARVAKHAPYQWVYIDGDHSYEGVKADWDNYMPMVNKGGIIAFHDILPPSKEWPDIEVERLWREIQRQGYVTQELVADPTWSWGGNGIVYV